MKKFVLVLCLLVALCGCSNNTSTTATSDDQQKETVSTSENNYLTKEEIKSLIKKIDITDDNWKDIFYVDVDYHEEVNNFGETVIDHDEAEAKFGINSGYIGELDKIGLELHDNVYGNDMMWENLSEDPLLDVYYTDVLHLQSIPAGESSYHDGDIVYLVYEGHGLFTYDTFPFSFDNFTCNKAGGYVYKIEVPEEYVFGDITDPGGQAIIYQGSDGNQAEFYFHSISDIDDFMNS